MFTSHALHASCDSRQLRVRRIVALAVAETLERRALLAAGQLDFSTKIDFAGKYDAAKAIALGNAGTIVVAGDASTASNQHDFGLTRLNSSGNPDGGFGAGNGRATIDFGGTDTAEAVAVLSDQSVLAAGWTSAGSAGSYDLALAKFTSAGQADPSFGGGDGMVTTHIGWGDDRAYAIVPLSSGSILVAGTARIGGDDDFIVARYTAQGTLDAGFNSGFGWRGIDFDRDTDVARAMAVLPNGKIVLAGVARIDGKDQFAVVRLESTGALDTSFGGGDGMVSTAVGTTNSSGDAIAVTSTGKILVAGTALFSDTGQDYTVVRYDTNGNLDTGFGTGGIARFYFSQISNAASAGGISLLNSGKFFVGGIFNIGGNSQFGLAAFNADGSIDKSFGSSGAVSTDFGFGPDGADAIALQPDGNILLAGFGNELNKSTDFAVARYLGYPIPSDRYESNNSFSAATNLGTLGKRTEKNLTIHSDSDDDFFRFVAAGTGQATIRADFLHADGDVDLFLYDSAQQEIGRSTSSGNFESISTNVIAGKTYYIKVIGYLDHTNPDYSLSIDAPVVANQPPTIASLSDSPDPVTAGQKLTLTAKSVSDPQGTGTIANVKFYRESNGKSGLQTGSGGDALLGTDSTSPYSITASTSSLKSGKYTYYARVTDKQGLVSKTVSTSNTVKAPEVAVFGNGVEIKDGDTTPSSADKTNLGSTGPGGILTRVFTVKNTGTAPLNTSNLKITMLDGTKSSGFTITEPLAATIAPGASDSFTVRFSKAASGTYSRLLSFSTNDSDEGLYSFVIKASVV